MWYKQFDCTRRVNLKKELTRTSVSSALTPTMITWSPKYMWRWLSLDIWSFIFANDVALSISQFGTVPQDKVFIQITMASLEHDLSLFFFLRHCGMMRPTNGKYRSSSNRYALKLNNAFYCFIVACLLHWLTILTTMVTCVLAASEMRSYTWNCEKRCGHKTQAIDVAMWQR